jgi:hypothetical protein
MEERHKADIQKGRGRETLLWLCKCLSSMPIKLFRVEGKLREKREIESKSQRERDVQGEK